MLVLAISTALAAPPAAAPDARGSLIVYCPSECPAVEVEGYARRRSIPRTVSGPVLVIEDADPSTVEGAQDARLLRWATPPEQGAAGLLAVGHAALDVGRWFEDGDTGEIMDAEALQAALDRYAAGEITGLVGLDDAGRLVSSGLRKVGLPELVPPPDSADPWALVERVGQALAERGELPDELLLPGCEEQGPVSLRYASRRAGEPPAPLARVDFHGDLGACPTVAPVEDEAPGPPVEEAAPAPQVEDEPVLAVPVEETPAAPPVEPSPDTLASVQARALSRLRGPVREAFEAGLPDGEQILVKIPFQTEDHQVEWLWMRLDTWAADGTLSGRMASEPALVKGLHRGDPAQAPLDYVFDYVWLRADGSREGDATGRFVE